MGAKYTPFRSANTPAVVMSSGTASLRAGLVHTDGSLYAVGATTPYGVARLLTAPLPTTAQAATLAGTYLPGTATAGAYVTNLWFDDAGTLYTCSYWGTTPGSLQKYEFTGATWAQPSGWPKLAATLIFTHPTAGALTPYGIKVSWRRGARGHERRERRERAFTAHAIPAP